jgi:hypothetical protein
MAEYAPGCAVRQSLDVQLACVMAQSAWSYVGL